jgi:hypothetical protein
MHLKYTKLNKIKYVYWYIRKWSKPKAVNRCKNTRQTLTKIRPAVPAALPCGQTDMKNLFATWLTRLNTYIHNIRDLQSEIIEEFDKTACTDYRWWSKRVRTNGLTGQTTRFYIHIRVGSACKLQAVNHITKRPSPCPVQPAMSASHIT